jgi:hypothetical protein
LIIEPSLVAAKWKERTRPKTDIFADDFSKTAAGNTSRL